MNDKSMNITQARNNIKQLHDNGLISDKEYRHLKLGILRVQARTDLHWTEKRKLYAIWGCA